MNEFGNTKFEWKEVRPLPQHKANPAAAVLNFLVPFVAATLLYLWGKTVFAAIVAGIAVILILLRFFVPTLHEAFLALAASVGKWLGRSISYIALTILYIFVFTPVALMSRLLRRDPFQLRWLPASYSYWSDTVKVDSTKLFDKPFLFEKIQAETVQSRPKVLRIGRVVYQTAVTLFLLNLAAGWLYEKVSLKLQEDTPDHRQFISVYQDAEWAKDYFREFHDSDVLTYEPFVAWGRENYDGKHVNVANGVRESYQVQANSHAPLNVFAFGGSTMWGIGSRDEHTVPSYLAKRAERDGIPLRVTNYAEKGYVNWQGVVRLNELCAEGNIPDIVLFLDGANDIYTKLQNPEQGRVHMNVRDFRRRFEKWHPDHHIGDWFRRYSMVHRIARALGMELQQKQKAVPSRPTSAQKQAEGVVTIYRENVEYVRNLAEQYGFKAWFFWQPLVSTKAVQSPEEKDYTFAFDIMPDVNRIAAERIGSENIAVDLSGVFDDHPETVYIDWAHLGEEGNRILADKMYEHLKPTLQMLVKQNMKRTATKDSDFTLSPTQEMTQP